MIYNDSSCICQLKPASGWLHRLVRPSNILRAACGYLKLKDAFGSERELPDSFDVLTIQIAAVSHWKKTTSSEDVGIGITRSVGKLYILTSFGGLDIILGQKVSLSQPAGYKPLTLAVEPPQ